MDVSPEEMLGWGIDAIKAQIHVMLPEGWSFEQTWDKQRMSFLATFLWWPEGAVDPETWEDRHVDQRINLFNAFGFLWTQRQRPEPQDSMWVRKRGRLTQEIVTQHVQNIADPPDLDPAEVAAVYESFRGKKS